jgi:hypothetical protein
VYGTTTNIGGFAGSGSGTVNQCFWDNITSGQTTSFGGSGKNTTDMMKRITFTDAGWDFNNIWTVIEGEDYPHFGMDDVNYSIMNLIDLHNMRYDKNGDFTLETDINASATRTWNNGAGFIPIGDSPTRFGGTFDGNNHTISGLYINRPGTNGIGLFGFTTAGCNIKYVSLNDVNITGYSYVGALAGAHDYSTTVIDSNSSGTVKGNNEIGGMFGRSYGLVERCSSTVDVKASNQGGGLIGVNLDGTVNNCFASGNVSGNYYMGGLVGRNRRISSPPTVTDSYATGTVSTGTSNGGLVGLNDAGSTVTGCFYDNITTGYSSGSPGTPKNTTDMMKWVTFSSAGWDLENVWNIMDGRSYPFFGRFDVSYMIYDLQDLHNMRYDKGGDYQLANDIDASATREWYLSLIHI